MKKVITEETTPSQLINLTANDIAWECSHKLYQKTILGVDFSDSKFTVANSAVEELAKQFLASRPLDRIVKDVGKGTVISAMNRKIPTTNKIFFADSNVDLILKATIDYRLKFADDSEGIMLVKQLSSNKEELSHSNKHTITLNGLAYVANNNKIIKERYNVEHIGVLTYDPKLLISGKSPAKANWRWWDLNLNQEDYAKLLDVTVKILSNDKEPAYCNIKDNCSICNALQQYNAIRNERIAEAV